MDQRLRIHRLIEQLPQAARPPIDNAKPPRAFDLDAAGFGAMLLSLLCGNRNLRFPVGAAKTVARLTHGRMYLAASTYAGIGHGRVPVRTEWVSEIATVLGISANDLFAISGIAVSAGQVRRDPLAAETAETMWNLRRLSAAQARHVREQAESMLVPQAQRNPSVL